LGWESGELKLGMLADFVTLDRPRHTARRQIDPAYVVYGYSACDVSNVVVGGTTLISQ
jgi:predicted amidohydrolase YtcJ